MDRCDDFDDRYLEVDRVKELVKFPDLSEQERSILEKEIREELSEERKIDPFKEYRQIHGRSKNTVEQYNKTLKRITKEAKGQGKVLMWYLQEKKKPHSASWEKLIRASLLYLADIKGFVRFSEVLRALPVRNQRQVTKITKKRRGKKDFERFENVLSNLQQKEDALALKMILATGARVSELGAVQLSFRDQGIGVKIRDVKKHNVRDFYIRRGSWAYDVLVAARETMGDKLFTERLGTKKKVKAFTDRWARACKKNGLDVTGYSCHALRHQHSAELKKIYFGIENGIEYIATRMGHTLEGKTTQRYGEAKNALGLL